MQLTELLSDLPVWAQLIAYAGLGLGASIMYLVGRAGFKSGMRALPAESEARVAAVVVEPSALIAATNAIEALNMTMVSINMTVKNFCHVVEKQTRVHEEQNEILEGIARELVIQREVEARTRR